MAKIELSDIAPDETVKFSIGNVEFKVPFETDDRSVVVAARSHPWLKVTPDEVELVTGQYRELSVQPKDDVLSALNDKSNDPDEVKKFEAQKAADQGTVTAIEAGLDQTKVKETKGGVVNLTLAADEADTEAAAKEETTTKAADSKSSTKSEATK